MTQATVTHSTIIRDVLRSAGKLGKDVSELGDGDDLYDAGLSSHASVNVMLGLEDALDIEFPDSLLRKSTFSSITAIGDALAQIEQVN
ncbi:acyl carrier protein [Actinomycetes bacterium M1A6_2h]